MSNQRKRKTADLTMNRRKQWRANTAYSLYWYFTAGKSRLYYHNLVLFLALSRVIYVTCQHVRRIDLMGPEMVVQKRDFVPWGTAHKDRNIEHNDRQENPTNGHRTLSLSAFDDPHSVVHKVSDEDKTGENLDETRPQLPLVVDPTPVKILFAIIAMGEVPQRVELIYENLNAIGLNQSLHRGRYQIDCLLFSFASYPNEPQWVHDMENSTTPRCEIVRMYKLNFVGFLKTLIPSIIRDSGYKYVFLLLDDVALTAKHGATFDVVKFFDIVESQRLHVASCAIQRGSHAALWPRTPESSTQIGRLVNMIELQATAFDINAWKCFYELIDTEYPSGWGLDMWFWNHCIKSGRIKEGKMGIIDTMIIVHNPLNLPTTNGAERNPPQLVQEQINHWAGERGVPLTFDAAGIQTLGLMFENESQSGVIEN
jgi:hypothetical protein